MFLSNSWNRKKQTVLQVMDPTEERKKKLEAGKEKLAAFQKKKAKKKKKDDTKASVETDVLNIQQNGGEFSPPDVSSPSEVYSVTDSDQFSFTSGDEWSAEEQDQTSFSSVFYQAKLAHAKQRIAELEETVEGKQLALDAAIRKAETKKQDLIPDKRTDVHPDGFSSNGVKVTEVESAVAKRDELISQLTQSLRSWTGYNIPSDEFMGQVQALVDHVCLLQSQLQQADQTLQEQLLLHQASFVALQSARTQMLQLQVIISDKDKELGRLTTQTGSVVQAELSAEVTARFAQYEEKIQLLEEELQGKVKECQLWSQSQQEWGIRQQELLGSLQSTSGQLSTLQLSQQTWTVRESELSETCEHLQIQQSELEADSSDQEKLSVLEFQLSELRQAHEADLNEIATLKRRNWELEEKSTDHNQSLSVDESLRVNYESLMCEHSHCLSEMENLKQLNLDLQEKIAGLSNVEVELNSVKCEYQQINSSYLETLEKIKHYESVLIELEEKHSTEKEQLNCKITDLQNKAAQLMADSDISSISMGNNDTPKQEYHSHTEQPIQCDNDVRLKEHETVQMQAHLSPQPAQDFTDLSISLAHESVVSPQDLMSLERVAELEDELSTTRNHLNEIEAEKVSLEEKVNKLQYELEEKEAECRRYTEEIIAVQDQLFSAQHAQEVVMSEGDNHVDKFEEHLGLCHAEKAALSEQVRQLEQTLQLDRQSKGELQIAVSRLEYQLSWLATNRSDLQDVIQSATADVLILKNGLQSLNMEEPDGKSLNYDLSFAVIQTSSPKMDEEMKVEKLVSLQSGPAETQVSQLADRVALSDGPSDQLNIKIQDLTNELESQYKLNAEHLTEIDQLKTNLDDSQEQLTQTRAYLKTSEIQIQALQNQIEVLTNGEQEAKLLHEELAALKMSQQQRSDREVTQEELQAQLESTVNQWQKLQMIVQEKEIELQNRQESLDEQLRICATLKRNHSEEKDLLQSQVDSLKLMSQQYQESVRNLENQVEHLKEELENTKQQLVFVKDSDMEKATEVAKLCEYQVRKDTEISNLTEELSLKESDNETLQNILTSTKDEVENLKNGLSSSQSQVKNVEDKLRSRESEVEILKDSLTEDAGEKETELVNLRISVANQESQVLDLTHSLTEKTSQVDSLMKQVQEKDLSNSELYRTIEEKDSEVHDLQSNLGEKHSEICCLQTSIEEKEAEITALKESMAVKESELQEFRTCILAKEVEQGSLQQNLEERKSEIENLMKTISEMENLKRDSDKKNSEIEHLKQDIVDKELVIDSLKGSNETLASKIENLQTKLEDGNLKLSSFQSSLSEKDSTLQELITNCTARDTDIEELKLQLASRESETNNLQQQLAGQSAELEDVQKILEEKISDLEYVQKQLMAKDAELEEYRNKIQELQTMKETGIVELRESVAEKEIILNDLQHQLLEMNDLKSSLTERETEVYDLRTKLTERDTELNDLRTKLTERDTELNDLGTKLKERDTELNDLRTKLTERDTELNDLKGHLAQRGAEIDNLNHSLEQQKEDIRMMKECVSQKETETADKESIFSEKVSEISTLRTQIVQLESEVSDLNIRLSESDRELSDMKTALTEKETKLDALRNQLSEKESTISLLKSDNAEKSTAVDMLESSMAEKDAEVSSLTTVVGVKVMEIDELNRSLHDKILKIEEREVVMSQRLAEIEALQTRVDESEQHRVMATQERDHTFADLRVTKQQLDKAEAEIKESADQRDLDMDGLISKVSEVQLEVESLQVNLSEREQRLTEVKTCLVAREAEAAELNVKLEEKTVVVDKLQVHVDEMEKKLAQTEEKLIEKQNELDSVNGRCEETTVQLEKLQEVVSDKDAELQKLKEESENSISELESLQSTMREQEQELSQVRNSLTQREEELQAVKSKLESNISQTDILQVTLKEKEEQLNSVTQENLGTQVELTKLQQQLKELEKERSDLKAECVEHMELVEKERQEKLEMLQTVTEKDGAHSVLMSHITDLETEIQTLKADLETSKCSEEKLQSEMNERSVELEEEKLALLEEMGKLRDTLEMNVLKISELVQSVTEEKTKNEQLSLRFGEVEKNSQSLKSMVSNLTETQQEKEMTLLQLQMQVEERAKSIDQLTDNLQQKDLVVEELSAANKVLHDESESVTGQSQSFLQDAAHQREILEQQMGQLEQTMAGKEQEMSALVQTVAEEKAGREQLAQQLTVSEAAYHSLLGMSSHLQSELQDREATLMSQQVHLEDQAQQLKEMHEAASNSQVCMKELNESYSVLKIDHEALTTQHQALVADHAELEQRVIKLQNDLESQDLVATQYMVESKQLTEKVTQLIQTVEGKEAEIFDLRHDCDMHIKEINSLKQELEQKDLASSDLKKEMESAQRDAQKNQEEKEMLKANFDACMEEMQQKVGEQEIEVKSLRSQLAEETKSVHQGQDQMKEMFEHQLTQLEEKLTLSEKQCETLQRECDETKNKSASSKDMYEHQLAELELQLQSTNSELVKVKDQLSRVTNNHACEVAGLKRLHDIQTTELEENCLTLERTASEQKRTINEQMTKFNREKTELEQSFESQLSDIEEKRRFGDMEISRLRKHLDEMKNDHEKDMQRVEKSYEDRMYEMEDKYCTLTNELERLRKSLMCSEGDFSQERRSLEMRLEELETVRRELQMRNAAAEDEVMSLKEQARSREEEMKHVLQNAAEKQHDVTNEWSQKVCELQHRLAGLTVERDRIKQEYEAQLADLHSHKKQLETKCQNLELHIEQDSELRKGESASEKDYLSGVDNLQKQVTKLSEENSQLKKQLRTTINREKRLRLRTGVEAICPPYQPTASAEHLQLQRDHKADGFSPTDEGSPILEGFVAEHSLVMGSSMKVAQHQSAKGDDSSKQEPDFVVEQHDRFQPETLHERVADKPKQLNIHPIRDEEIKEGFQPETPDLFLVETMEETDQEMVWRGQLSVGMSPSFQQLQQQHFEFNIPNQSAPVSQAAIDSGDQNMTTSPDTPTVDLNSNSKSSETQPDKSEQSNSDVKFEKRLTALKEDLEEEYVAKMRRQEVELTYEFESQREEYQREMEQHLAQRLKAVKYDWERKFNKALQKVKKEMERRHLRELRQARHNQHARLAQLHQSVALQCAKESSSEVDLMPGIAEGSEELGEVVQQLHKENQELAEVRDVLLRQIEISQARGLHTRMQHELQTMLSSRESVSSTSSTTTPTAIPTTPTLVAGSPTMEAEGNDEQHVSEGNEAESSRSEASESSSARERFLEELEEITQHSSQDLPLEWELTTTVIEAGDFEREPEHHSVWEVFDGRCLRQDCQEVRHRFHKLYQWVVKNRGEGNSVLFDDELKLLMESSDLSENSDRLANLSVSVLSKNDSTESSHDDHVTDSGDISNADFLAKVVALEADKLKLEGKLADQMSFFSRERLTLQQQCDQLYQELVSQATARKSLDKEVIQLKDALQQSRQSVSQHEVKMQMKDASTTSTDAEPGFSQQFCTSTPRTAVRKGKRKGGDEGLIETSETSDYHLQLLLFEKEEEITKLKQELAQVVSDAADSADGNLHGSSLTRQKLEHLQEQLHSQQELLGVKDNMIRELRADLNRLIYPQQTDQEDSEAIADGQSPAESLAIRPVSDSHKVGYVETDLSLPPVREEDRQQVREKISDKHSSSSSSHSRAGTNRSSGSGGSDGALLNTTLSPLAVDTTAAAAVGGRASSVSSDSSSILLATYLLEDTDSQKSGLDTTLDLQDRQLAQELSQLHKDLKETKAIYSKENTLLQQALDKEKLAKELMMSRTTSGSTTTSITHLNTDATIGSRLSDTDKVEILKQRLAICLEQTHMLEDENACLRTKLREQEAIIVLFKNKLQQKDHETEEWRKSFNQQLTSLQKQRSDLLQLIKDIDSGKEARLSDSLQGAVKEDSLRQLQEDLMERMEELDHLHKMLTQKQIELQHCEAERRHLEQLCLLKDMTEVQLMKQKRLMEEQVSEIELRLRDRETTLVEEKMRLLQELKAKDLRMSQATMSSSADTSSVQLVHRSSSLGDLNLSALEAAGSSLRHNSSQECKTPRSAREADQQHLEAIEKLKSKLKLEYEIRAARLAESQASAIASYWERQSKH